MRSRRTFFTFAAAALVAVALTASAALAGGSSTAPSERRAGAPPGKAGGTIVLDEGAALGIHGWDALVTGDGTTYLGWIASHTGADRTVYVCRIGAGSSACDETLSTASLGPSSAHGLKLLQAGATVRAVWFHDTNGGPGKIATSTVTPGTLTPANDQADAPAFGGLYDATMAPDGSIWAVTYGSSGDVLQIHPGLGNAPVTLNPADLVGRARIAFDGARAIVVFDVAGSIGDPVRFTFRKDDGTWSAPARVPGNSGLGGAWDLAATTGGSVRLVSGVSTAKNASFFPQVARWQGTKFGDFRLTGYRGDCAWNSHDLYADASGRLADVSFSCDRVRVMNQPAGEAGAWAAFTDRLTPVFAMTAPQEGPQIATAPRGTGWVMWAHQQEPAGAGDELLAAPVRLPALPRVKRARSGAGVVMVTGPASCMPASDLKVGVRAKPARGWSLVTKRLRLDGAEQGGTLAGASLAPSSRHTLTGTATFRNGSQRRTVAAALSFTACPAP